MRFLSYSLLSLLITTSSFANFFGAAKNRVEFSHSFVDLKSSWTKNFYTDDSQYYLKLKNDGFTQRVRFTKDVCNSIRSVDIIFKNDRRDVVTNSQKIYRSQNSNWPKTYGIDENSYCWFEASATGIELNSVSENAYALKINFLDNIFYYGGLEESLIPGKRVKSTLDNFKWIQLGANGATPVEGGGVFFKIWEPEVDKVELILNGSLVVETMTPDLEKGDELRSYIAYLPYAEVGDEYYFQFVTDGDYLKQVFSNDMAPTALRVDPMAKELVYDRKGGKLNGYNRPRGVVPTDDKYEWKHDEQIYNIDALEKSNRIIYQIWPLTFNPKEIDGKYVAGKFDDITEKLDYISSLGVNAVELLPVHESKFYASWGYSLDSLLLIESSYGTGTDLKELSDALHSRKIQLILDIVLNHVNNSLIRDSIGMYDDQSKYFSGSTDWGPRPRYSSIGVRRWMIDSLSSLIRDYHVDGLRFDMTKYIYNLGGNASGYKFLQEMTYILKQINPNIYLSAEELPDNVWVTKDQEDEGLGFDSQWNDKFKNAFEEEFGHYREYSGPMDLNPLKGAIYGYSNHTDYGKEYRFDNPLTTVNYLGSHDFIGNKNPILRLVADYNFYEQVDNNYFSRVRPLEGDNYEERFKIIHNDFVHSVGRAAYGILFTKPGAILFFQGEELANDINIENEWSYVNAKQGNSIPSQDVDMDRFVRSHRMPWEYLTPFESKSLEFLSNDDKKLFSSYHNFFKDMIMFKRMHPKLNLKNAYEVKVAGNGEVLSYQVDAGSQRFFVVLNFGGDKPGEWVTFPKGNDSWWIEKFNSSRVQYSGKVSSFRNVISQFGGRANRLRLKSNSFTVFERSNKGEITEPLFLRGTMNDWGLVDSMKLVKSSEQGHLYSVNVEIDETKEYEFKLGSRDWKVEVGSPEHKSSPMEFGLDVTGQMGNEVNSQNVKVNLQKGKYRFIFNIMDYKFNFNYLN